MDGPTISELRCLAGMLKKAAHKNVAEHFICGFMWTIWPEWYDRYFRAWQWQASSGHEANDTDSKGQNVPSPERKL